MTSNTASNTNIHYTLNFSTDWDRWNEEFIARANDSDLGHYVNPDTTDAEAKEFIIPQPKRPAFSQFTKEGTEDPATQYGDLSDKDQSSYRFLITDYNSEATRHARQLSGIAALRQWVSSTVAEEHKESHCRGSESLRTWYSETCP